MKYRFTRIETAEQLLAALGADHIPSNLVTIRCPAVDEQTGEILADIEVELPEGYSLSSINEEKLKTIMMSMGMVLKEKI